MILQARSTLKVEVQWLLSFTSIRKSGGSNLTTVWMQPGLNNNELDRHAERCLGFLYLATYLPKARTKLLLLLPKKGPLKA